ncbi:signal peptidase I [Natronomonas sp.]|uniref:signal peptidase I n=1 Tax=Natronomonas sp. TaxID=2184060 RepID=UPI002FC3DAA9
MKPTFRTVANVLAVLLLIAVVAPFVVYAVPETVGADHSFVVLTASMTPAIAPGDVVIVADRDPATIRTGDVITFTRGTSEIPVTHRVTAVLDEPGGLAFETQGDANDGPDASPVQATSVVGTVILTIPYIGYVVQFTNSPYGFVALVVLPLGLFVVNELWSLYRHRAPGSDTTDVPDDPAEEAADGAGENAATPPADGWFLITTRSLEGAFLVLVPLGAYSGYVAYTWPTAGTIAVAFGTTLTALGLLVVLVAARRSASVNRDGTEMDPLAAGSDSDRPATDGGVDGDGAATPPTDRVMEEEE